MSNYAATFAMIPNVNYTLQRRDTNRHTIAIIHGEAKAEQVALWVGKRENAP